MSPSKGEKIKVINVPINDKDLTYLMKTDWSLKPDDSILKKMRVVLCRWEKTESDWEYVVWTQCMEKDNSTSLIHGDYCYHNLKMAIEGFKQKVELYKNEFSDNFRIEVSFHNRVIEFGVGGIESMFDVYQ